MSRRWIFWRCDGRPVPPDTLVYVRLRDDRSADEGLLKQPRRADSYRWTKASGITHYIISEQHP